ncbi:hypothetical protein SDC9_76405 [bioreactor metagenome]|uniref:Uncharacterized protein n=1 Tax=bioreactor metagenome TaxID=1076179 RepID=A0A644YV09_9ZZZZ
MEVSDQIIKVLDNLSEKVGIAVDWSQQNILPYLQELMAKYINYEIMTSIVWIIVMFVLCAVFFLVAKAFSKRAKKDEWDEDSPNCWAAIAGWVIFGILSFASIFVIVTQTMDIVRCVTFPEMQIIEYLNQLASSK